MTPPLADFAAATRLGWLDALRGWAAMVVAFHHAAYIFLPDWRHLMDGWVDPGRYGVLVFFLLSGYIVPASLERRGSVRAFWVSRIFRIYPLLAVASFLAILPFLLGVRGLRAGLEQYEPVTAVVAHMTMMQDLLAVPNAINVLWTLSYEMAFYLLVVALFVVNVHRRSASVATGLTVLAVAVGAVLPTAVLSGHAGVGSVVSLAALAMVMAIALAMSDRPGLRTAGGLMGGVLTAVLVTVNGRIGAWEGMLMLAVMFTGTVVYRAEHGQISRRTAFLAAGFVLAGTLGVGLWHAGTGLPGPLAMRAQLAWSGSVILAAATFAAGWLLRRRRFPRWATWLGTISFSIYLLHSLVLMAANQLFGVTRHQSVPGAITFFAVLIAASWATQRWIEAPAQRLGRRLARRPVPVGEPQQPAPALAP
ncbi:acyltransferase [Actinomadura barringtoniae]|uniref:Acyltransferase n=1 Tax=Actinomadura barringtoniae TaxID=1427535 RepID=A0A939PQQ2_9ACTN|nr:acyltransferase [Actinomadura barringtoniae]MBO2453424.1 acyltransferase [Actinomadura barringtoniae]